MAKNKNRNRSDKAAVQSSPENQLPVAGMDAEMAEEAGYRPDSNNCAPSRKSRN
jgi:hypothetical protein